MVGNIKNYNIYLNKLLDYCKLVNVVVYDAKLKNDKDDSYFTGEYRTRGRVIKLEESLTQKETLAVLLHEIGHFIDEMFDPEKANHKNLLSAYQKFFSNKPMTHKQKLLIIDCETTAWNYGRVLAKKLKIPVGDWFEKEMMAGLAEYNSIKTIKNRG